MPTEMPPAFAAAADALNRDLVSVRVSPNHPMHRPAFAPLVPQHELTPPMSQPFWAQSFWSQPLRRRRAGDEPAAGFNRPSPDPTHPALSRPRSRNRSQALVAPRNRPTAPMVETLGFLTLLLVAALFHL